MTERTSFQWANDVARARATYVAARKAAKEASEACVFARQRLDEAERAVGDWAAIQVANAEIDLRPSP